MIKDSILELMMRKCIDLATENITNGQYPIAAIIANKEGNILAASPSDLRKNNDPTNHPEIAVIREASEKLQSRFLKGYYLFTTLEPCPMCAAAAVWAKMQGIVYGASQEDAIEYINMNPIRQFSWRQISIKSREVIENGYPRLELYEGVLRDECNQLFL